MPGYFQVSGSNKLCLLGLGGGQTAWFEDPLVKGRKQGSWLKKMDSNDRVISIYRPRHRKRLPIARKFSAIWGAWMVSKNN